MTWLPTRSHALGVEAVDLFVEHHEPGRGWRAVNTPHPGALVRAGARFERGHLVERAEAVAA
ncbi:hypothetical protein [Streptomyces sp. NPDC005859]|uniref:hypothetical protein n=1 Tax=Streptomyces sp. NPDC005859 TaxID=3157170 RepID=UPI0033CD88CF